MEELLELKEMAAHQRGQLDVLSRWLEASQRPQSGSHGADFTCWRCQQPGHLARDCDEPRVPAGRQPSPTTHPEGNGRASTRRSTGGQTFSGLGSHSPGGGLPGPRRTSMSIQPSVTPSCLVLHCLCVCMCMFMFVLLNLLGTF